MIREQRVPEWSESIATLPPISPIFRDISGFSDPANESLRRTGLQLTLSAKFSFYLPAFEISRSCGTASERKASSAFDEV